MLSYSYYLTEDNSRKFVTEDGHEYLLYFSETAISDGQGNSHAVHNISLTRNGKFKNQPFDSKFDEGIRNIVTSIINDVFKADEHRILVYFCFGDDGYSRHRNIVFNQWCRHLDPSILKHDLKISYEGRSMYGSIGITKDNPLKPLILDAFNNYLKEIADKDPDQL